MEEPLGNGLQLFIVALTLYQGDAMDFLPDLVEDVFVPLRGAPPPDPPLKSAWRPPRFTDIFHQIQQE